MIPFESLREIGRFGKPHGVKGEMNSTIDADIDIDALPCILVEIDGLAVPFFISSSRSKGAESVLISLDGVDSQEAAAAFTNKTIYARAVDIEDDGDEDDDERLYLEDLVGFNLVANGAQTGTIVDYDDSTENYLFSIELPDGRNALVPANPDLIEDVDIDSKTIYMNLPQGLIDLQQQ